MNRQHYKQYNIAQNAYSHANTSDCNNYNQQQGWYAEQYYQPYNHHQQQHYENYLNYPSAVNLGNHNQHDHQQHYRNYKHNQISSSSHLNGPNFQYSHNNKWGNKNQKKRSHEYVDLPIQTNSSQTVSPEPKKMTRHHQNQSQQTTTFTSQCKVANQQKWQNKTKNHTNIHYEKFSEEKAKDWTDKFEQMIHLLSNCRAGEEVRIIISVLQPNRSSWVEIKNQVVNDLSKTMTPLNFEKILMFGSTLTELDFHGSDLDFFIQLKNAPKDENELKEVLKQASKQTRYLQGSNFQVICMIPHARVPLIRLMHKERKVICDVNFNSKFGYYNSYFIAHILKYDRRIKELAIILKLWSKSHRIASQMILSNYCLVMLLFFYLQNNENPMLDTIYNNQRSKNQMILDLKYKWNFYFNDNINKSFNNHQSLRELLIGFFEFYDKLNFKNYIVSLYTGKLIKRSDFEKLPELEDFRNLLKENNLKPLQYDNVDTFVVQDGFELNLNIGSKVKKHTEAFFEYIKLSYEKCIELKDKPFSELLINLFTDIKISKKVSNESKNKNKKSFQMKFHVLAGDLKLCQDILTQYNKDKILTMEDQQKFYFDNFVEHTEKFLKEIYLCTVLPELSGEKSNSNVMEKKFKVILPVDTINGRKKMIFKDDDSVNTEKLLSKKLFEKKTPLDLDIFINISSADKGKTIDIDMFDNHANKKTSILTFGNYFSINVPLALKYFLRKLWCEVMKN
ncbi:hypothetical protein PVAND_006837 [Polypedilum vanderplanki]|uniref:Uncharacterized protein n=1 Tax=Polypedilum vanderplanki TaxID=319348 RepID=A0A9J6C576_POLVA|nr:hypothetical protein PVAND_006837 [Polypedilum vanderplanki]